VTHDFDEALASYDFETAKRLLASADPADRESLEARLDTARDEADTAARELSHQILELARENDFAGLLELDAEPHVDGLLRFLPPELERGARVQLEGARKWLDQRTSASRRHLRRAAEAIDGFDTVRGAAELRKVDDRWLTDDEIQLRASLQDRLDGALRERQELEMLGNDVLSEHEATVRKQRRLTTLLWIGAIAVVAIVAVVLLGR
jgi:hypothetical protein